MIASTNFISCNFSPLPFKPNSSLSKSSSSSPKTSAFLSSNYKNSENISRISYFLHKEKLQKKGRLHKCQSSSNTKIPQEPSLVSYSEEEENDNLVDGVENGDGGNGSGEEKDWTTSFLLFAFWAGLMYYIFFLAPNQTPVQLRCFCFIFILASVWFHNVFFWKILGDGLLFLEKAVEFGRRWWVQNEWSFSSFMVYYGTVAFGVQYASPSYC